MTLVSFALCGLAYLGVMESRITPERCQLFIDWIYSQQITASGNTGCNTY
jgi:hypothetical protein